MIYITLCHNHESITKLTFFAGCDSKVSSVSVFVDI